MTINNPINTEARTAVAEALRSDLALNETTANAAAKTATDVLTEIVDVALDDVETTNRLTAGAVDKLTTRKVADEDLIAAVKVWAIEQHNTGRITPQLLELIDVLATHRVYHDHESGDSIDDLVRGRIANEEYIDAVSRAH